MNRNSISVSSLGPVVWNETDEVREPHCKTVEEHYERRRTTKRLRDCELPEGFRLVTERPKQYWMGNQLVWGFCLAWARVRNGVRSEEEFLHVARYFPTVNDEIQMSWAIDDFRVELADHENNCLLPMRPIQTVRTLRMAS